MRLSSNKLAFFYTASILALSASAAQAQGGNETLETVVVTGSRVIADIANSPTPITAVSAAQLTTTSPAGIAQGLDKLPIFMGSSGNGNTRANGGSNGAASNLNLRNFGSNRNLILFDGHRIVNTQANGAVNTDILPEMLIQRVDVVTGGASAVYGSDAVTGVVNFILDKNFTGFKYQASAGTNGSLQGTQIRLGVAAGSGLFGGRGHVEGTVKWGHTDQVFNSALPYGRHGLAYAYTGTGSAAAPYFLIDQARLNTSPFGGLITCTGCSVNGQTFVSNGVIGPYNAGVVASSAVPSVSQGGTGGYTAFSAQSPQQHTAESFGRFSYNLTDSIVAAIDVRASEAQYYNLGGFMNITVGNRPNQFAVANPYLSATAQAALAKGNTGCPGGVPVDIAIAPNCRFTLIEVFGTLDGNSPSNPTGNSNVQSPRVPTNVPSGVNQITDREMNVTFDLSGQLASRWDWDLFFSHDEAREKNNSPQNINFQAAYAADDAVVGTGTGAGGNGIPVGQIGCYVTTTAYASRYPGCVPINPFGPSSMTALQYQSIIANTNYIMTNKMDDVGGSISGSIFDLPAGPVKAALSGEARFLSYQVTSNKVQGNVPDCNGLRMCSTGSLYYYQAVLLSIPEKTQSVYEFAGEVGVPLLKDMPLAQDLTLSLAGRYTDYSISGPAQTWKVGFDWHVMDELKFRGTMSVDIRAPTLNDLYLPPSQSSTGVTDQLTGFRGDINSFTQGNAALTPEVGRTYTVGAVFTPTSIPDLVVSVDYYRINLYNAITSLTYATGAIQQICIQSGGTSSYCALVQRPFPYTNTTLLNAPTAYINKSLNSATQKTEGVDVEINYGFDLDEAIGVPGRMTLKNLYSYQPYVTNVSFPGAPPVWTAMPKSRNVAFLGYAVGSWSVNVQDRWLGGYNQNTTPGQFFRSKQDQHIPSYNQVDLTINKKLTIDDTVTDLYLSVQDVTNARYPIAPSLTSSNPGAAYPVPSWGWSLGRYFTLGLRGSF